MYYRDFKRENGDEVQVAYRYRGGSPDTYTPMYGAVGGDPPEVEIESAWVDGKVTQLSDEESEKYIDAILADPPEYEPLDDDVI